MASARLGGRSVLTAALLTSSTLSPRDACAEAPGQRPIGFSNLVLRVEQKAGTSLAPEHYRVAVLERLRALGFAAVGAESLVFGRDEAAKAERVLGGTIERFECLRARTANCRMSVHWQVMDVAQAAIVYEGTTSAAVYGVSLDQAELTGRRLVVGALERLAARPKFRDTVRVVRTAAEPAHSGYAPVDFEICTEKPETLPGGADTAMDGTVVVEASDGFGSGFFLNREGLVLTAAHVVVTGPISIRQHDGARFDAVVLRHHKPSDVALLRPVVPRKSACLPLSVAQKLLGADVYVVGSPASRDFAFSLSRGIVSSARVVDGNEFWQTDAPINPGNSGGPMLTSDGRVFAIASWKVTGGIEGLGFGTPVLRGLRALALAPSDHTAPELWRLPPEGTRPLPKITRVVDEPDSLPTLDPEAERARIEHMARERVERRVAEEAAAAAEAERLEELRLEAMTPSYVKTLKWGGIGLAAVGGVVVVASYASYEGETTSQPDYRSLRLVNDVGWVTLGLGAAASITGFALTPRKSSRAGSELRLSSHGVTWQGTF